MQRKSIGSDGAERLRAISLLSGLTAAECQMLARMVDEVVMEPGEELMHEGDFGYEAVFLEEGSANVVQDGVTINTVGPGDAVGELAVLDTGGTRTASVVATTPLRGLVLTSHFMHHVRQQMPALAEVIDREAAEHRERDRLRASGQPVD